MDIDINVKDSLRDLSEELELRRSYIKRMEESCKDLELKISTLRAAQTILESRTRSAEYIGKSFKEIVITETEKLGSSLNEYLKEFKNEKVKESVAAYLTFGKIPPREYRDEICVKAANLFELEFKMLMDSLEIDSSSYNPYSAKKVDPVVVVEQNEEYLIPKDFGGFLRFNLKRSKESREDFAKSLGISLQTVSNWCGNRNVPRDQTLFSQTMISKFPGSTIDEWRNSIAVTKSLLAKNKGAGH